MLRKKGLKYYFQVIKIVVVYILVHGGTYTVKFSNIVSGWNEPGENKERLMYNSAISQKMKFSVKDFFSNMLKKSLMENFIFCAVCSFFIFDKVFIFGH